MANMAETELYVTELCQRFNTIFQQIKELKQSRIETEQENTNLLNMIREENEKFEEESAKLNQECEDLESKVKEAQSQQQKQKEEDQALKDEQQQDSTDEENLQEQLEQKRRLSEVAQTKLREVSNQVDRDITLFNNLQSRSQTLQCELESLKEQYQQTQDFKMNMEANLEEVQSKDNEIQLRTRDILQGLQENEDQLKLGVEDKFNNEGQFKLNQCEFRDVLNRQASLKNSQANVQKHVEKLYNELQSKEKRLHILHKQYNGLMQKVQKLEQCRDQYANQSQINTQLALENEELRAKISLFIQNRQLNNDDNKVGQSSDLFNSSKRQASPSNRGNIRKYLAGASNTPYGGGSGGGELLQDNQTTNLYKQAKQFILNSDQLVRLQKAQSEKDNEIYENKKQIAQLNENLTTLKQQLFQNRIERDQMHDKHEVMSSNTKILKEQYNQLCEELGISQFLIPSKLQGQIQVSKIMKTPYKKNQLENNNKSNSTKALLQQGDLQKQRVIKNSSPKQKQQSNGRFNNNNYYTNDTEQFLKVKDDVLKTFKEFQ